MAVRIDLQRIPNQVISTTLDENRYELRFMTTNETTSVTVVRNGETLVSNSRATPAFPILPYMSQFDGNFIFATLNDNYPFYTQFGINQFLLYFSQTEIEAFLSGRA